ncbi:MAG TPA: DoxX family protein [Gemmatimonadaceae bacterium]|nr:DoxX family protein [Gemmatimonadaceae bacterium]
MSIGLFFLRSVIGLVMAGHGAQKLLGWFGGYGLDATGKFMTQIGFHPGKSFAAIAAGSEILSGLLVAFGFLGPIGPALMISVMIVAAVTVHWGQGLFAPKGIEVPLLYAAAALGVALTGYGEFSLDAALGISARWTTELTWIVLAAGMVGGVANLALRRRPATTTVSA